MRTLLIIIAVVWLLAFNAFFIYAEFVKSSQTKVKYTVVEPQEVFYSITYKYGVPSN